MSDSSGSEITYQAELERQIYGLPFHRWLMPEATAVDLAERSVVVTLNFRPELGLRQGAEIFHGGVVAALADITGHAAVAVWQGGAVPTIGLQIDYLAPAQGKTLVAQGRLRKLGRTLGRADVEMSVNGKLVALARGTFSVGKG